jgi:hypothetical protein
MLDSYDTSGGSVVLLLYSRTPSCPCHINLHLLLCYRIIGASLKDTLAMFQATYRNSHVPRIAMFNLGPSRFARDSKQPETGQFGNEEMELMVLYLTRRFP